MNAKNMPGFTAEASLYTSGTQYNMNATRFKKAGADIRPQLRPWPKDWCIPGCVCVSPINCPCCDSIGWPWPMESTGLLR